VENESAAGISVVDRRQVTFLQAEGAEPLPSQLALREVSQELAAKIWLVLYGSLNATKVTMDYSPNRIGTAWREILSDWFVNHEHGFADEFTSELPAWTVVLKAKIASRRYLDVFEFLQFVLRHRNAPSAVIQGIAKALADSRAAYFITDRTIYPKASETEGQVLEDALSRLRHAEYGGARLHLATAATLLSQGDYAGSVRESASAVESIARTIEPEADKLSTALAKLQSSGRVHNGLRAAMNSLYGYASDEEGVRHSLVFQGASMVDEPDAIFMLGACASFITFVIRKGNLLP
jgi:hypothetical protein